MTKLTLEEPTSPDHLVIGISCHVNDYRLCWSLNRQLKISLTRRRSDMTSTEKGRSVHYSVFDHVITDVPGILVLVNNHGSDGVLVKEQRQADYFMVLDTEMQELRPELLEEVRQAEFVLTAFPIELASLRSGDKLLQCTA